MIIVTGRGKSAIEDHFDVSFELETLLRERGKALTLVVKDNGRGITKAQRSSVDSIGLLGMNERARLLGGRLTIAGVQGRGTTITVQVPAV